MSAAESHDVIVVGGGPAGAVMAWALAARGIRVAVVERARFPREKVCGDFVEPGGLRILDAMNSLRTLERQAPLPITHACVFVQSTVAFRGAIPYYQAQHGLPPHGYIVPRSELDSVLLQRAREASATIYEGCSVNDIRHDGRAVQVGVFTGQRRFVLRAPLVVGADGVESTVARSFDLMHNDPRYVSIAQRGYVEGVTATGGEAAIWFDEDLYPGYGWMFPMFDGQANVGVGILSEACRRFDLSVPKMFNEFIEKLRRHHPGCAQIRLLRRPLGGVVKTYAGIGANHFHGGLLIGDAGSFVDPMTGEGITPSMESALIAAKTVSAALACGRFDALFLSRFERDFRQYFDPGMRYLELWAVVSRNRHLREFCLRAGRRGWQEAASDPVFARVAGASFGGLELRPAAVMSQVCAKVAAHVARAGVGTVLDRLLGKRDRGTGLREDFGAWQRGMRASLADDLRWHSSWTRDVAAASARLMWTAQNPRIGGLTALDQWRTTNNPAPTRAELHPTP